MRDHAVIHEGVLGQVGRYGSQDRQNAASIKNSRLQWINSFTNLPSAIRRLVVASERCASNSLFELGNGLLCGDLAEGLLHTPSHDQLGLNLLREFSEPAANTAAPRSSSLATTASSGKVVPNLTGSVGVMRMTASTTR